MSVEALFEYHLGDVLLAKNKTTNEQVHHEPRYLEGEHLQERKRNTYEKSFKALSCTLLPVFIL